MASQSSVESSSKYNRRMAEYYQEIKAACTRINDLLQEEIDATDDLLPSTTQIEATSANDDDTVNLAKAEPLFVVQGTPPLFEIPPSQTSLETMIGSPKPPDWADGAVANPPSPPEPPDPTCYLVAAVFAADEYFHQSEYGVVADTGDKPKWEAQDKLASSFFMVMVHLDLQIDHYTQDVYPTNPIFSEIMNLRLVNGIVAEEYSRWFQFGYAADTLGNFSEEALGQSNSTLSEGFQSLGMYQSLIKLLKHEGSLGLYKRHGGGVVQIVPFATCFFMTFEQYELVILHKCPMLCLSPSMDHLACHWNVLYQRVQRIEVSKQLLIVEPNLILENTFIEMFAACEKLDVVQHVIDICALLRVLDPKWSYASKTMEIAKRTIESSCFSSSSSVSILMGYDFVDQLLYYDRNGGVSIQELALNVVFRWCGTSEEDKKVLGDVGFLPALVKFQSAKSFEVCEMAAVAIFGIVMVPRNRKRFVHDDYIIALLLQLLNPEEKKSEVVVFFDAKALIYGNLTIDNEPCSSDGVTEVELLMPFLNDSFVQACNQRYKNVLEITNSSITSDVTSVLVCLMATNFALGCKAFTSFFSSGKGIMCGFTMRVLHFIVLVHWSISIIEMLTINIVVGPLVEHLYYTTPTCLVAQSKSDGVAQFYKVKSVQQGMEKSSHLLVNDAQEYVGNVGNLWLKDTQILLATLKCLLDFTIWKINIFVGLFIIDFDAAPNIFMLQFTPSDVRMVWKANYNNGSLYEMVEYIGDPFDSSVQYTVLFSLENPTLLHIYTHGNDLEDKVNFNGGSNVMILVKGKDELQGKINKPQEIDHVSK